MGGNARDEKWWDDKVISTAMEIGSSNIGDGKDVLVCRGMEGDVLVCEGIKVLSDG